MRISDLSRRRVLRGLLLLLLTALGVPALSDSARAHAVLVKSAPASRAVLSYAPTTVDLWFNERLEAAFSTMSVWSAAGTQVDRRDVSVAPGDGRRISVSIGSLAAGTYTVRFRVLSVDGHVVEASFPFTVRPAP